MEEDREKLLAKLDSLGGASGNSALLRALGWNSDRYWRTRNDLIAQGVLTTGKGRGGSVRTIGLDAPIAPIEPHEDADTQKTTEVDYYAAIEQEMKGNWLRRQGYENNARVNVCAHQGRKPTGGKWTRPDLIMAAVETYEYVPGKRMSITTFEVKLASSVNVTSVYEAASHLRSVHYAYLIVVGRMPADLETPIRTACLQQLVGLIVAEKAGDSGSWDEWVPAERNEPEPRDLNNTIYHFVKEKEWLKREVR